jgi:hypothetical protein
MSFDELVRIIGDDEEILKAVWKYAKSSTFSKDKALEELRELSKDRDLLKAVINYAKQTKSRE